MVLTRERKFIDSIDSHGIFNTKLFANSSRFEETPIFSRKVFVGGLPTDVPREYIERIFREFGPVIVDWPRTASHPKSVRTLAPSATNGYVFLVYEDEKSVKQLIDACIFQKEDNRYWLQIESPTVFVKAAQVRPWFLKNINYVPFPNRPIDHRLTVFVGGVPRPATARELAVILERSFGPVIYAGVDVDPSLRYPKGAARVTFGTRDAYLRAISGRFVKIENMETSKREVEIKPYVMEQGVCDECSGRRSPTQYAEYFCGHKGCLQYYCSVCWNDMHSRGNRTNHLPCVRQGDQSKDMSEHSGSSRSDSATDLMHKLFCDYSKAFRYSSIGFPTNIMA